MTNLFSTLSLITGLWPPSFIRLGRGCSENCPLMVIVFLPPPPPHSEILWFVVEWVLPDPDWKKVNVNAASLDSAGDISFSFLSRAISSANASRREWNLSNSFLAAFLVEKTSILMKLILDTLLAATFCSRYYPRVSCYSCFACMPQWEIYLSLQTPWPSLVVCPISRPFTHWVMMVLMVVLFLNLGRQEFIRQSI